MNREQALNIAEQQLYSKTRPLIYTTKQLRKLDMVAATIFANATGRLWREKPSFEQALQEIKI